MNVLQQRQSMSSGDNGLGTLTSTSVCLGLAWISVLLRCYTRACLVRKFHLEDWIMILSLLFFTPYCGLLITATISMTKALSIDNIVFMLELVMVVEVFYVATIATLKVAVALLYLRVVTKQWLRYVVIANVALSTVWAFAMFFFTIFSCGYFPNMYVYATRKLTGKCVPDPVTVGMGYSHGAVNAFTDWVFVLVPIYIVKGLVMKRREKIIVASLMAFASFGAIASIIRMVYIPQALMSTSNFNKSQLLAIWTTVEQGVGIIAVSISTYRPLLRKCFTGCSSLFRGSSNNSNGDKHSPSASDLPGQRVNMRFDSMTKDHEAHVEEKPSRGDDASEKST